MICRLSSEERPNYTIFWCKIRTSTNPEVRLQIKVFKENYVEEQILCKMREGFIY